jgi:hypothetical protein
MWYDLMTVTVSIVFIKYLRLLLCDALSDAFISKSCHGILGQAYRMDPIYAYLCAILSTYYENYLSLTTCLVSG